MVAHGRGGPRWVAAGDPIENPLMGVANVGEGPCPRGGRGPLIIWRSRSVSTKSASLRSPEARMTMRWNFASSSRCFHVLRTLALRKDSMDCASCQNSSSPMSYVAR